MAEMVLSADYKTAVELNEKIIFTAQLAQKNLYDMCVMLKQMRDDKLYKELGYANFEDYCENEVGFSREQGRKYISIIENKNANSSWHLGVTKLYLLSTLSESQQEEIQQTVNLEETSVRELKAEIEKLKDDNNKIRSAKISMESDLLDVKSSNRSLRHQLDSANDKIKELENRPVEVAVVEDKDAQAQIKQLSRELSEADQNHVNEVQKIRREYQNQINDLSRQLTEMTEQAETKKVFLDVDAILCPCVNNLSTAMEMLIKSLEEINDPSLIKEAGKTVDDYRWKMDDIFDIFYEKFGK